MSSFAPSLIHRSTSFTCSGFRGSPSSGISGSGPLIIFSSMLLPGSPATTGVPPLPPFISAANVVMSKSPLLFSGRWQPLQADVNSGLISLW